MANLNEGEIDIPLLMRRIQRSLNAGRCGAVRFALVVWCDCQEDEPPLLGSNNLDDGASVIKMLRLAADIAGETDPIDVTDETVGHA